MSVGRDSSDIWQVERKMVMKVPFIRNKPKMPETKESRKQKRWRGELIQSQNRRHSELKEQYKGRAAWGSSGACSASL